MLELLRIRNLALIADMELEFTSGMNVLTGETGAGKSFILKALHFLMGEKMSADMVRAGKERAQVEALFALPDKDLVIRRELMAENGRSRLYINDSLASQEAIKELRPALITLTSQHGQQRLLSPVYQHDLIDHWMNRPDLLTEKNRLVANLKEKIAQYNALIQRSKELTDKRELFEMHLQAIEKVQPQPGEEEALEAMRTTLRSMEQKRQSYSQALDIMYGKDGAGLLDILAQFERALDGLQKMDERFYEAFDATVLFRTQAQSLAQDLRKPQYDDFDHDPEEIEARLYAFSQLKRKLHRTMPEILALRTEIQENLSFLDVCELDCKQVLKEQQSLRGQLTKLLATLDQERQKAAASFCSALVDELAGLGFGEHIQVLTATQPHELVDGCMEERLRLVWAPNPGQAPQPLDRIASGGELSRFLLATVSLQAQNDSSTLIFDEVDAGIGGLTLNKVGDKLAQLADQRQMLLITHWPQLASRAKRHFHVHKDVVQNETFTLCAALDATAREQELARMAGHEVS